MTKIFLAGSRKFAKELQDIYEKCTLAGIEVLKGRDSVESLSEEAEKKAHLEMLRRIDQCDVVYIVSKEGYIGKTVAMEIGYAIAKNKQILSMEKITEAGLNHFVTGILSPKKMLEKCRTFAGRV